MMVLLLAALLSLSAQEGPWPQFLGPNRDNRSTETGLLKTWPEGGPKKLWTGAVGLGYASVSVVGDTVYTQGNLDDACWLFALKETDGSLVYKAKVGPPPSHNAYPGTRATPTIDGDRIYVLGESGDLVCFQRADGAEVWRKHMEKDFGGKVGAWKYSESPLVDGDRLIFAPGGKQGAVLALDKATGATRWRCAELGDGAEYSSLFPTEIGGVKQYVFFAMKTVAGIGTDGKLLWKTSRDEGKTAICTTPIARDGIVFVSSAYGVGSTGFKVEGSGGAFTASRLYETDSKRMQNHHGGVILHGDHLYGLTERDMQCVEFKTGKVVWSDKSVGKGSITYADGHFIVRSEKARGGEIALVEATPEGYREKGRFSVPDPTGKNTWAYPVVARGRLYIRNQNDLFAFDVKGN